jgi:glyoxylase-like metal-dependent hydrolase (beta-lactamase superfamily II)
VIVDSEGAAHVIDPGVDGPGALEHLEAHVARAGGTRIASVLLTHAHFDHSGLAGRLRSLGALVLLGAEDAAEPESFDVAALLDGWGVPDELLGQVGSWAPGGSMPPPPPVDGTLDEGILTLPGRTLEVIATPGHTAGSRTLVLDNLVFTGDTVLPTVHPGLGLGGAYAGNPLVEYLAALDALRGRGQVAVCPGHEYRFAGLDERLDSLAAHHLRRRNEIAAALADDPSLTAWEVAARIHWTAGWEAMEHPYRFSALSQVAMMADSLQG